MIARDPVRYRPMMILAVLEKFSYGAVLLTLFLQHRLHASDMVFFVTDTLLGILFLIAFFKTPQHPHD
jgi:hypothetical protein